MDKWYTDSVGRRRLIRDNSINAKGFYDDEKNRVYIKFSGHPGHEINQILKDLGFSYSKTNKYYYAPKTQKTEELLVVLVGTPEQMTQKQLPTPKPTFPVSVTLHTWSVGQVFEVPQSLHIDSSI